MGAADQSTSFGTGARLGRTKNPLTRLGKARSAYGRKVAAMKLARRLAVGVICVALIGSASPTSHAAGTCWDYSRTENALVRKINHARYSRGIQKVARDRHLARVSRYHTREMTRSNSLFHTSTSQILWRVTNEVSLGENVGYAGGVRKIFKLMMASAPHRANILYAPWNYIGIGTARKGRWLWVTMTFEARRNPGTKLSMPKC
jgi:uncharacterized protein YkwD